MQRLDGFVKRLQTLHGAQSGPPTADPSRSVLWEYVAYLADDKKRLAAWTLLEQRVGTDLDAILSAPMHLVEITRSGGSVAPEGRAEKMKRLASCDEIGTCSAPRVFAAASARTNRVSESESALSRLLSPG